MNGQDAHRASLSFTGEIPPLAANTRLWSYRPGDSLGFNMSLKPSSARSPKGQCKTGYASMRLQRVLRGEEMMALQGWPAETRSHLRRFWNRTAPSPLPTGFKPHHWHLGSLSESTISRMAGSAMSVHMTSGGCTGSSNSEA